MIALVQFASTGVFLVLTKISIVQSDSITTPNIFWVKIRDLDILDDDVGCTDDAKTFALEKQVLDLLPCQVN